jgi:two-component system sensor histidine kinase KdpD
MLREPVAAILAAVALAALTALYRGIGVSNATVPLSFLTVVLALATVSTLRLAILTSLAAMGLFNFFFLPPVGTLTIADPQNWVALLTFLAVSLVASNLSNLARARAGALLDERKSAELTRQREELQSALLASFAHDLKTPLTAIRVAAGNLEAEWLSEDQRREQRALVLSEVERLSRLFEGILDMARIDAGAVTTDRVWVHPQELVEAAHGLVDRALAGHDVRVMDQANVAACLDPRLTSTALARLLENAAAYSPAGSPVDVTIRLEGDGLELAVRDHGPGVAPSDMPSLFDRFFRGRAAAGIPGTGMGLAIARGLLAAEHGNVWADNHADGGAVFTIHVPAETRPAVEDEETTA